MPDNAYNTPPVSSIFPTNPVENDVVRITGIASESPETTITKNPVYEAPYGNNETPDTSASFNTSSVITITETPNFRTETGKGTPKPTTPIGEIPDNQPVSSDATLLTIQSDEIEKKALEGFTQKVSTIV